MKNPAHLINLTHPANPNPPQTTPFVPQPSKDAAAMIKAIDAIVKRNIPAKVKL